MPHFGLRLRILCARLAPKRAGPLNQPEPLKSMLPESQPV